jgi:hypothetical protein
MKGKQIFIIIMFLVIPINVIIASTDKGTLLSAGIREEAEQTGGGVGQLLNDVQFLCDCYVAYKNNEEWDQGVAFSYPFGQNFVKIAWWSSGKQDRSLGNSPNILKYNPTTPPLKDVNKIEAQNPSPFTQGADNGFISGANSIGKEDRERAYTTGYFDTNENHVLDKEEVLTAIDEWYADKFDLNTLAEVLNLWDSPIAIESATKSDIPSVSLNADPSPAPCGNEIKATAIAKVFGVAPLSNADISMTAKSNSGKTGPLQMLGKTDNNGKFTWFYTPPPHPSVSCGDSIEFTASVTKNGKSATATLFVSILPTITPAKAETNMVQTIQIPSDQSSKDQLKDQLHSQIVSGIKMIYVIQPLSKTTTTATSSPTTGTTSTTTTPTTTTSPPTGTTTISPTTSSNKKYKATNGPWAIEFESAHDLTIKNENKNLNDFIQIWNKFFSPNIDPNDLPEGTHAEGYAFVFYNEKGEDVGAIMGLDLSNPLTNEDEISDYIIDFSLGALKCTVPVNKQDVYINGIKGRYGEAYSSIIGKPIHLAICPYHQYLYENSKQAANSFIEIVEYGGLDFDEIIKSLKVTRNN